MDLPRYSPRHSTSLRSLPSRLRESEPPPYSSECPTSPISAPPSPAPNNHPTAGLGDTGSSDAQQSYTIGRKTTRALVKPGDILAHLHVLGAFRKLREDVRSFNSSSSQEEQGPTRSDDPWTLYLARAAYRFELWVKRATRDVRPPGRSGISSTEIPPLDVLMVWHTYLLNPRIYSEDCLRMYPGLLSRGAFPLHEVASWIDPLTLLPRAPSRTRSSHFESVTGQPFLAPMACTPADELHIDCPSCSRPFTVNWVNQDGTGYGQDKFQARCSQCKFTVDKTRISIAKFCRDVTRIVKRGNKETLAGMLLGPVTGTPATEYKVFNAKFMHRLPQQDEQFDPIQYAKEVLEWNMEKVEEVVWQAFVGPSSTRTSSHNPPGLNRLLSFYRASGAFSIDLVKAIQRQERFTDKMALMNWTDPHRFQQDDPTIIRCINQYHAFLHVMANNPTEFLIPTLSIDLAWHTHQLFHETYRKNTLDLVRTFVDHDDNVEQNNLAVAYEKTAHLWRSSYGIPYSVCGCPPPPQPSVSLPSITKLFSWKGKDKPDPATNPRPDLLSRELADADETHPSEHPAIRLVHHNSTDTLRKDRKVSLAKRAIEERKAMVSGKADQWAELVMDRNDRFEHDICFTCEQTDSGTVVDWDHLGLGECVMGIGKAGLCGGGNHKQRAPIDWIDPGWGTDPLQGRMG